jgi:RimJ/RimL family protein N-acetyltransferase
MNREPYVTDGVYSIFPISEEDRDNYVELHRQLNGAHSLEEDTPEIGIDLLESMRNKGIATKVVPMFARKTYEIKPAAYFLIRISSENPHSKHVFEKMGATLIGEEEKHISINEVVYQYKLVPELFM